MWAWKGLQMSASLRVGLPHALEGQHGAQALGAAVRGGEEQALGPPGQVRTCPAPARAPLSLGVGEAGKVAPGGFAEESIRRGPEPLGGPLRRVGVTLCGGPGSAHTAHPGVLQPCSVWRK